MSGTGALPKEMLSELLGTFVQDVASGFLNPASIDLPLSEEAYRLESIFLPKPGCTVRSMLEQIGYRPHDLSNPLEVGVAYLIRVGGSWSLPKSTYAYANPKSSSGRVNLFCRLICDGVTIYDHMPEGFEGECWMLVRPDSFPIVLAPNLSVAQVRIFDGKSFLNEFDTAIAVKKFGLIFDSDGKKRDPKGLNTHADSIFLSLAVGEDFGYECRGSHKPLDFGRTDAHDPFDYFTPISAPNGTYTLRKGSFYILSTLERVMVPPYLSAELRPIDVRLGEFRSHAAGYIDPGWGFGENGEAHGRPITLEVIPHEDMTVHHGQTIARVRYERMKKPPSVSYDSAGSNYVLQSGPRLSKHFRSA